MPAAYAVVGPLQAQLDAADLRLAPEHASVWSIAPRGGRYACAVNGEWLSRTQWHLPLRDGDLVLFVHVAHGGGGSNPVRFLLQLAVIAASFYLPGAFGLAQGTLGYSLASAATAVAGMALVNLLAPLPSLGRGGEVAQPSPTYTVALAGNQARLGQSVPVGYGHELTFPDFGAIPYSEFDEFNDQYYCATFVRGIGHYEILQVLIDDTPLEHFAGVTCLRVGPGQSAAAGPFTGVETFAGALGVADSRITSSIEIGGQDLVDGAWHGPFTVNASGTRVAAIFWDVVCPRGLGTVEDDGSISSRSIVIEVQARSIDVFGRAVGAWGLVGTSTISAASTTPVRRSYAGSSLPAGTARYQVRMRRVSAKSDNNRHLNDIQWVGLRGRLDVACGVLREDVTGIALRVRANEQLSGLAQRRIALITRRLLPVYDADLEEWSAPQLTRNPAHAFADLLHDAAYGRGLPDWRIDHGTLAALAQTFEARQDRFDFTFDTRLTVDEALRVIARAGRAVPLFRRGALYSMVRDERQAGPVAAFMPRNMEDDSFTVEFSLPTEETPDAVRLAYRNNATWTDEVVIGQVVDGAIIAYDEAEPPVGVDYPAQPVDARLPGVTGRHHALREAAYIAADSLYRRTRCGWTTEFEGLAPTFGSLVALGHDVSRWAQSGDILQWDGPAKRFTPAGAVQWTDGVQHYVRFQARDGSVSGAYAVSRPGDDPAAIELAIPYSGAVVTDSDASERTRFLFGRLADVTRHARVVAMQPQSQRQIRLAAVIEDNRVHDADAAWLPSPGAPELDPPGTGGTVDPEGSGGGGASWLVNITGNTYYDVGDDDATPSVWPGFGIAYGADGRVEITPLAQSHWTPRFLAGQWLAPQPVTAEIAALYEIRFEPWIVWNSSGQDEATILTDYQTSGDAFDTWLSLGTTRTLAFEMPNTAPAEASAQFVFRVRIRRAADEAELGSAQIQMLLQLPAAGGGG